MNNFDFSPLFRSSVGFDQLMRLLDSTAQTEDTSSSYPPYNIEKTGDQAYRIAMAVAGFTAEDLSITAQENMLLVVGKSRSEAANTQYLHRGIAARAFERRFQLADFIRVGDVSLENGLLNIDLIREIPESMKPRQIEIKSNSKPLLKQNKTIDQSAA